MQAKFIGEAHFMSKKEFEIFNKEMSAPYGQKENNDNINMILSKNCRVSMESSKTHLNNNVLVIGGAGSGKTESVLIPNLLQKYGSYIINDPCGELYRRTHGFFKENGYIVKVFDPSGRTKSLNRCKYNPFQYVHNEVDINKITEIILMESDKKGLGDPFYEKSQECLLKALIIRLVEQFPKEERNFETLNNMLKRTAESFEKLCKEFDHIKMINPEANCLKYWDNFKKATPTKTMLSVAINLSVKITALRLAEAATDDLNISDLGNKKSVLYVISNPNTNDDRNKLISMFYYDVIKELILYAENLKEHKLEVPVRFIFDEFANMNKVSDLTYNMTIFRKYNMSCMMFIQSIDQLKQLYQKNWEGIVGLSDIILYLGTSEPDTTEYISNMLGEQTVHVKTCKYITSLKDIFKSAHSVKLEKRALVTPEEIMRMDQNTMFIMVRGQHAIYDMKYNSKDHPEYCNMFNLIK